MAAAVKTLKKWAVNFVFGENFQGFADMKEYENGTETYDKKRYEILLINTTSFILDGERSKDLIPPSLSR